MAALSVVGGIRLFTMPQRFGVFILIFRTLFVFVVTRRLPVENEADMMNSLEIGDWCEAIWGSERLHFDCEIEIVDLERLLCTSVSLEESKE